MSELISNKPQPLQTPADSPISVLVVDDQPIVVESIRRLLATESDIEIQACNDPTQALSMAAELLPSVILQDLVMPDVDGLMLVKFFRAHPKTKETPIIVLSSKDEPKVKASAFAVGANDYLVKLPDPVELVARLRYHAKAYQSFLKTGAVEETLAHNKALEARVEARTAELSQALDDLKQAQAQIIHNEKMNSMGQLVAGIAHEVNNPINFIYGNLNYMKGYVQDLLELVEAYQSRYPSPSEEIDEKLENLDLAFTSPDLLKSFVSLRSGAQRIRNLVLSLRNFSRFEEVGAKVVDVHEGLDSTLAMLGEQLENIATEKNYGELPMIECYASQLNQVFMHIIRNAIDAFAGNNSSGNSRDGNGSHDDNSPHIGNAPKLHIATSTTHCESTENQVVSILITDNGPGISPEIQDRIFDPFFTTKDVGAGTGLGLSISHQIVAGQHGGTLKCYSVPGQGTKFLIELPVRLKSKQALASVTPADALSV
ncbi:MAG: response regulator [Cyanobacteria bacterium J06649_5]